MSFLYNISIYSYLIVIQIASLFNAKAKLWIVGRKDIFKKIKLAIAASNSKAPNSKLIWFHCASLGEFEQGRPLMELMKKQDSSIKILLTFFSPSGYEIRKNYSGADLVFYLPIDTPKYAQKFIEISKPTAVFFIKYEFWYNYLNELKNKNIPTYLVSGIFREDHYFFKPLGSWFRKQLDCFTHFYLQDEQSEKLLNSIGYANTTVTGDTRFDRVSEVAKQVQKIDFVEQFIQDKKILIVGSSWEEDEKIIANFLENPKSQILNYKIIIAPHEIDENHIASIEAKFIPLLRRAGGCLRYSSANESNIKDAQILIIDNIGMLSSLYQYGTIAYIGGGFGKGIHNILEAATFGLPIIFGPNYQKFTEAKDLIKLGGAFSIKEVSELEKTMLLLEDKDVLQTASHISKYFVQSRVGASDKIFKSLL